ncbi:NigD1/NigD2 family lipoprotein [Phocaeicola oris]|uniref:NigD1/NigD2 family lipoprotein n=1 Tax=Phocaeicola oris TaxID=2896850 RepID=UPI00234EA8BE|nr:NigD-like C-terminal domain-containing protein [Phocaeicola oris]MCE2616820.1 hypothetical protein [Phocaeicola oris]
MKRLFLYISLCTMLAACSHETDYIYPNLITEILDMTTDSNGTASTLIKDNGTIFCINNTMKIDGLSPDSTFRILAKYAINDNNGCTVYSTIRCISPYPIPREKFKMTPTDPVTFQSGWVSGNYLNASIVVRMKEQLHSYHFIQDSITSQTDGHKSLYLTLLHFKNNDVEGYNKTIYLSVPLYYYKNILNQGDKVYFSVNTYKNGLIQKEYTFPKLSE